LCEIFKLYLISGRKGGIHSKIIDGCSESKLMKKLLIIIFFSFFSSFAFAQVYQDVTPGYKVKFPDDFYYKKDYRVQWWYFTGHLFDGQGREFGYELTFFSVNVQQRHYKSGFGVNNIYISHFAISDIAENRFFFSDNADAGAYAFAGAKENQLEVWTGKNLLEGTMESMHIRASGKDDAIDIKLNPEKPVVLNGQNGYSRKSGDSPLNASIYFSYTSLKTDGTLKMGKRTFRVKGTSWFDREISSMDLSENQPGWDWFALQLDDRREIMLYMLRKKDGSADAYSSGTVVYPDGKYKHLPRDAFKIRVLSYYDSKKTGARYPSQWEIGIPSENIVLKVIPLIEDQEILAFGSTGNYYWEGTCRVEGAVKGRAYVELTGY
jgi:predicted secreted hydrolase